MDNESSVEPSSTHITSISLSYWFFIEDIQLFRYFSLLYIGIIIDTVGLIIYIPHDY